MKYEKEITKEAKKYFKEEGINIKENIFFEDAMRLTKHLLENANKIDFDFTEVSDEHNYHIEATVFIDLIISNKQSQYAGVVFDYDVKIPENFDDLIYDIIEYQEEALEILKALDPVNYKPKK